jgi:transcriptional regulator with XRE-family HTH domain
MRIKEVLKEKGMTQQELADKLGISRQALGKQINGKLLVETAQRIADALGVSITELFEKRPEPTLTCPHCGKEIHIKIE